MARSNIQDELKGLVNLLHQEKEEDLKQYRQKMASTSLKERRKSGVCWYPVDISSTKFDAGERLIVKVARQPEHIEAHSFQSGKLVSLFSNAAGLGDHEDAVSGVINNANKKEMMITINTDEVPSWVHNGHLGVQLLFDENAYREMDKALQQLIKAKDGRINDLKEVLLGSRGASFKSSTYIRDLGMNESQNSALYKVKNAEDVAIIHGPPGTGKTTTMVQAIMETLKTERQVLVCAPSNAAVDLLAERLGEQNIEVLRIGHPARVNEENLSKTLDARIANHKDFKNLKSMRKKAEELFSLAKKHKRNFGQAEKAQRRAIKSDALKIKDDANHLEYYIINDIIASTQVIASTLVGTSNSHIKGMTFDTVFIDEAAQALEPATWIPILKSERVIFAGDHCQLPPTIRSFEAARAGLEVTLFEKAIKRNDADVMLNEQYRMHTDIMHFSSKLFYNNQLVANEMVANWSVFPDDKVVEFIDTAGCGFYEAVDKETRSSYNVEEADLVIKHLSDYINELTVLEKIDKVSSIGIISPYKAQTILILEKITDLNWDESITNKLAVNTVDSFQGQERDVIYISMVRSNDDGVIGFLGDARRMNVALTRARKKLVVIGDSATIGQHDFYQKFLDYINEIDAYRSAFELIY